MVTDDPKTPLFMPTAALTPSASSPDVAGNKGAYTFSVIGGMLARSIYCTGAAITADDGNDSLYIARSSPPRSFMATVAMKLADELSASTAKSSAGFDLSASLEPPPPLK